MALADFTNFELPSLNDLQGAVGPIGGLDANSFSDAVRNFHLNRLPKFEVDAQGAHCAYCGKLKDRRALQIDHIIPLRIYIRGKMAAHLVRYGRGRGGNVDNEVRRWYSHEENLVLACQKCNSAKSERAPDMPIIFRHTIATAYDAGNDGSRGRAVSRKLDRSRMLLAEWRLTRNADTRDFIFGDLDIPSHTMNTRRGGGPVKRRTRIGRRYRYDPLNGWADREDGMRAVQNVLVRLFGDGRPALGVSYEDLRAAQAPDAGVDNTRDRRVCFYCLGMFNKQSFQLDHINPINRGFGNVPQNATNARRYNDPTNIIPVCRTCNASKGNAQLSRGFLQQALQRRQNEGLGGLEDALTGIEFAQAQVHQRQFFNL